jgi:hypothetical protein
MPQIQCRLCNKLCKSLQGWKIHMSGTHGGYDDAMLAEIAGVTPLSDVRSRMESFSRTLDVDGSETEKETTHKAEPQQPLPPPPEPPKRVKATPKKFKKILSAIPAQILKQNGIELDSDDEETLDEASDFLSDMFGIEFVVPQSKKVIESRLLSIVWVAGIVLLVYVKHRLPELWRLISSPDKKGKKKDETPSARRENQDAQNNRAATSN